MKMSNWSRLGYLIGFFWSLGFAVRYVFVWQDYSQAIQFISLGLILMALSWVYDQFIQINNTLTAVEDYLDERK